MTERWRSNVQMCVGTETFDFWQDLHVSSSMLDASDGFSFRCPVVSGRNDYRELTSKGLVEGAVVTIWARDKSGKSYQQHTGRIDDVVYETSIGGGSVVSVSGRDHMGPLVDSDSLPSIAMQGVTFKDVIYKALAPQGFTSKNVFVNNDANRELLTGKPASGSTLSKDAPVDLATMSIAQARPHAGETVHSFLMRHAKRFGLLMWGTAKGDIVFGRPDYNQKPLYSLQCNAFKNSSSNNVEHVRRHRSARQVPSEVHVFGKSHGHDWFRSEVHAVVEDDYTKKAGFFRVLTISDHNCRTKKEAEQRGKYELSLKRQSADTLHMRVADVAQDGIIQAIDTVATVSYDVGGIHNVPWYVVGRTFDKSHSRGTETQLSLLPKGAIALGQTPFSDREY